MLADSREQHQRHAGPPCCKPAGVLSLHRGAQGARLSSLAVSRPGGSAGAGDAAGGEAGVTPRARSGSGLARPSESGLPGVQEAREEPEAPRMGWR